MNVLMSIPLIASLATIEAVPKTWVVDSSTLPNNSPIEYLVTLRIELSNGNSGEFKVIMGKGSDAQDYLSYLTFNFSERMRPGWKIQSVGLQCFFREVHGKPFRRITVTGEGPKPTVRWEFAPPKKK